MNALQKALADTVERWPITTTFILRKTASMEFFASALTRNTTSASTATLHAWAKKGAEDALAKHFGELWSK